MANRFSKKYGNKEWTFNYLQMPIRPDATSLHHCLQNHRQYYIILNWIQVLDTKAPVVSLG